MGNFLQLLMPSSNVGTRALREGGVVGATMGEGVRQWGNLFHPRVIYNQWTI